MSDDRPSKTQRKREMHDLQSLGTELVGLSEQQLASIELPERLLDAVMEAKHMTKFEAKRRQMQYIGKIMRDVDPEPIRERLAAWKAVSTESTARLHAIERWRKRLLEDENAMTELVREYPSADAARLRTLIRNAAREREQGKAPRSFREIFKVLTDIIPSGSGFPPAPE
jgi:ribosome-associated protein